MDIAANKESNRKYLVVGVLVFFVSFCGLMIVILIMCKIIVRSSTDSVVKSEDKSVENHLKYIVYNPTSEETTTGIATIPISSDTITDFTTFSDPGGNVHLVSKFGSGEEYKCYGSCHCSYHGNEYEEERRNGYIFTRGFYVLVSSVSTVVALNYARNLFDEECHQRVSEEECPSENIRSEVEECVKISMSETEETKKKDDGEDFGGLRSEDIEFTFGGFLCTGVCVLGNNIHEDVIRDHMTEIGEVCQDFKMTSYIKDGEYPIDGMVKLFMKEVMIPYCKYCNDLLYRDSTPDCSEEKLKIIKMAKEKKVDELCAGQAGDSFFNIKCRPLNE